jgi:hypothetical protein
MPRKRPKVVRSIAGQNTWAGGVAPPDVFTLRWNDAVSDYKIVGTDAHLKDYLVEDRNPPLIHGWSGLALPEIIDCSFAGGDQIPQNYLCKFRHEHWFWRRVDPATGDLRGKVLDDHEHEFPLSEFVSASWDETDPDNSVTLYAQHWH